ETHPRRSPAIGRPRTDQKRQVEAGLPGPSVEIEPLRPGVGPAWRVGDCMEAIHLTENGIRRLQRPSAILGRVAPCVDGCSFRVAERLFETGNARARLHAAA